MQGTPLLLLGAAPGINGDAKRSGAIAREELKLLRVVPALEAQRCSLRVLLDIRSAAAQRVPREKKLVDRLLRRHCAGATTGTAPW